MPSRIVLPRDKFPSVSVVLKQRLNIVLAFRLALPAFARIYNDRGVRQQLAGRITSAIDSYERAISLAPDFALANYNLGAAYDEILQYDKALVEYQTAIQNDPQLYFAYNNLARIYHPTEA